MNAIMSMIMNNRHILGDFIFIRAMRDGRGYHIPGWISDVKDDVLTVQFTMYGNDEYATLTRSEAKGIAEEVGLGFKEY